MNTILNHRELVSSMLDGEVTEEQFTSAYALLKDESNDQLNSVWDEYHRIGDVLRSDELDLELSVNFSNKFSDLLDQEPIIFSPKKIVHESASSVEKSESVSHKYFPRYVAMTSIAAAVMVAFIMAPQIISLLRNPAGHDLQMAKKESDNIQTPSVQLANNHESSSKELEFAPKLMNQVEMLRDPNLDSYLMAHQKASPAFANNERYVKKANIDPSNEVGK